jgi:hypothetical protein
MKRTNLLLVWLSVLVCACSPPKGADSKSQGLDPETCDLATTECQKIATWLYVDLPSREPKKADARVAVRESELCVLVIDNGERQNMKCGACNAAVLSVSKTGHWSSCQPQLDEAGSDLSACLARADRWCEPDKLVSGWTQARCLAEARAVCLKEGIHED